MKVALARVSSYQSWYKVPSLGLGYLAAILEKDGVEVKIFDARFFNMSNQNLIKEICRFSPDVVGFTTMTHEIKRTAVIAETLKDELHAQIIIGGCHISALPAETMEEFPVIDYGVVGEGEDTLLELIRYLDGHGRIEDIEGLVYKSNGNVTQNKPREPIVNLDHLPFPAFHHYFKRGKRSLSHHDIYYQIVTSRGCPFNCAFCMRALGKTVRRRSAENIISEIEFAIVEYGAHTVNFADEVFLFNNTETKNILNEFIKHEIPRKIRWSALTRADLVDRELISLAKKSGCYRLEIGVESGNNEILKRINKRTTVEQIESAVNIIKKEGIKVASFYILGHPGENEQTIRETIDLAAKLNTETIAVGVMVPYPGTKIYEWAQNNCFGYRLRSTNWDDYDKFGNSALEIEGLTIDKLESFQRKAYLYFYLRNFRLVELLKFVISRYRGILAILNRQLLS